MADGPVVVKIYSFSSFSVCDLEKFHRDPSVSLPAGCREAKRQTAGIKFTRRPKISIFAPQGRLVAPTHVKFGNAKGARGSVRTHEISRQSVHGVGTRPQNIKHFYFLLKSHFTGANPFTDFNSFYGLLCAQQSYISVSNLM